MQDFVNHSISSEPPVEIVSHTLKAGDIHGVRQAGGTEVMQEGRRMEKNVAEQKVRLVAAYCFRWKERKRGSEDRKASES
jgi:hypothetical protein